MARRVRRGRSAARGVPRARRAARRLRAVPAPAGRAPAALPRLETLVEAALGTKVPLTDELRAAYGGDLTFPATPGPHVYANFVSTIDGLVSYGIPGKAHAGVISRGAPADRFVMGLLRACADVVVSGAGTLRAERAVTWTARAIFPAAAEAYAELRRRLGRPERQPVAILTASGDIDLSLPVFAAPDVEPIVVTGRAGAARIGTPGRVRILVPAEGSLTMRAAVDTIVAATGARLVLSEAGPTLFGKMLAERVVDELFLTVAPQLAGRSAARPGLALVDGEAFDPTDAPQPALVGAKRAGDLLLLRYALRRDATDPTGASS